MMMKRSLAKILLLLSWGVFPMAGFAQTHYNSNVSIGLRAGADVSRVMFNPSVSQSWKPGPVAGFTFRYIEENHFGIIAELDYMQMGWKEDFEQKPFKYERTLNYLQLPVMTHLYFGRRGKFFFNAGPVVGCMLGESAKSDFNPSEIADIEGFPINGRINDQQTMKVRNRFDYGICAGIGGEFNINRGHSLSLEARFCYGLGNIMPSRRADVFSSSNSMTITLALGYWFRIK